MSSVYFVSPHAPSPPPSLFRLSHPPGTLDYQEYNRYKERLLKAENQLVNSLGFDFMIEHPFSHSNDLVDYLCEEGKARGCPERKLCVLCSRSGISQTSHTALMGKGSGVLFDPLTHFWFPPLAEYRCW